MQAGQTIAARFVLEGLAASGGMGSVYRARDTLTGQTVALKLVAEGSTHDLRFLREAEVLASLTHPGIVRYVAHGVSPGGQRYLAMEWLDGEDLSARLYERGVSMAEGVALAARVSEALGHAHARGVVHRDVKPANIFLVGAQVGDARLIDFGIARVDHEDPSARTRTGTILGTSGYLAPEQARGGDVSPRSDVFSLGCVLFEILTGRPPFVGDHLLAVLAKILAEEAPSARGLRPEVPPELDALVARMLAKDPADRPEDGAAVAAALGALGDAVSATGDTPRRAPQPTLTAREQQLVSVILVGQDAGGAASLEAPTVATGVLSARLGRLREAASPFGAVLEAMLGGVVLATMTRVGGATDHAARAARCALAMRASIPEAAMVLATGRATLADRLPVGAVIDRAAEWLRRMRAAGERALLVDELTAGLLDPRFDLRGAGAVRGFELVGERESPSTARTLLGRPTACLGRERELGVLLGALEGAVATPCAQVVLVTAPPGVGKSRLRQEFLRRAAARDEPPSVWLAAGDPLGAQAPFGLLSRWLRHAAGLVDGERAEARRQKLRARLARCLSGAELDRAAVFLGEVAGGQHPDDAHVELRAARRDPALMGEQVGRAFSAWLAAESTEGPVVLVLEDLQWGDLASVRLVGGALRALGERAVLLLALARPDMREDFSATLETSGALTVALGPLPRRACERIAREALGARAEPAVIERLVERSEGNALYLEELVRAVAEGDPEALPETVLAMVAARLDRLDPQARRVLRAASVFGQEFVERGVAALLGGAERSTQVGDRLRQLVDAEVLLRRGDGYAFRHGLLRDASYALLTERDRALGHRLAAEWLLEAGDGDPALLAEHFARGDRPALAGHFYLRAAEQALEGGALAEALSWGQKARAAGVEGEALGAVRRVEARAHSLRDENAQAAEAGEQALGLLPRGSAVWHQAAADLSTTALRIGAHDRLVALAEGLAAAEAPAETPTELLASRVIALARTAIHLLQIGQLEPAARLRESLEAVAARGTDDDPSARAWRARLLAVEALRAGDPSAYLALTARVAADFELAGDRSSACAQRGNVGYALAELGDFSSAERVLRETLAQGEALGLRSIVGLARHNLGLVVARRGALAEGAALQREALAGFVAQGHRRLEGFARAYLARILSLSGEHPGAEREARLAASLLGEAAPSRAFSLAVLAEALLAAGRSGEARESAREASELLGALGGIEEGEALIRLMDAETRRAEGDDAGAREAIAQAEGRLLARASTVSDGALRQSFLDALPEHRRTRELAAAWR